MSCETEGNRNGNRIEPEGVAQSTPAAGSSGEGSQEKSRPVPVKAESENQTPETPPDPDAVELHGEFPGEIQNLWREWKGYRRERSQAKGQRKLAWTHQAAVMSARMIERSCAEHGPERTAAQMMAAMAGNWQGLNFDRLQTPKPRTGGTAPPPPPAKPEKPSRPAEPEPPSWRSEWQRLRPRIPAPATWAEARQYREWLSERSETVRREIAELEAA